MIQQCSQIKNFIQFEIHEKHALNTFNFFSKNSNLFFYLSNEIFENILINVIFVIFIDI